MHNFENFNLETLRVESVSLKGNPLKDAHLRYNPVLVPKEITVKELPVVLILAGFTGNGPKYFNVKPFEENAPQVLDRCFSDGKAPQALYVFVDAFTKWGGSQFVNSAGCGSYEDYITTDLYKEIILQYPQVSKKADMWCITGGSSGGYGALHLVSKFPHKFSLAAAIAPDSYFEMSLLPEILSAKASVDKIGGIDEVEKLIEEGRFFRRRDAHTILNAIGMAHCYSGEKTKKIQWPVDEMGLVKKEQWKKWLAYDPIHFLSKRKVKLKKVKKIFLDVGKQDQFFLQYGSRQIHKVLKDLNVKCEYSEFNGNHFDISERRPMVWSWLKKQWKK